jgi:hypothetical protein
MTRAHDRQKTLPQRRCTSFVRVCRSPAPRARSAPPSICRHVAVAWDTKADAKVRGQNGSSRKFAAGSVYVRCM